MAADDYKALFETFALEETVVGADPGDTIKLPGLGQHSLASLPPLNLTTTATRGAELRVGRTLGEGGMGVIRAAVQSPFERDVALKTVRADRAGDEATAFSLLREAIAAGRLEHPNVVPIYAVGRDAAGLPVIVMKRIDGGSWRDLLDQPERVPGDDPLTHHLGIFLQVCAAIAFAHEYGLLHRDLKPDNVMVGEHEDVYVVDWGLAVTLQKDASGRLPCVDDVTTVAGTPAYMAPEMASGGTMPLDARTDIYCLGAVLHEIVTGTLRHQGESVFQMMLSAYTTKPVEYDDSVPAGLARICNKATAHDPEERFQTAGELREEVQAFLEHRSAAALTRDALTQLSTLDEVLADPAMEPEERRVSVYRLYGAARFGLERSLAEWSEQPEARQGLQVTLELMIDWELRHGSTHAAAALVAELPEARPDLSARVREMEQGRADELAELEALRGEQREHDIHVGSRGRAIQVVFVVIVAVLGPGLGGAFGPFDPMSSPFLYWLVSVIASFWVIVSLAIAWWNPLGWLAVEHTKTNWQVGLSLVMICFWLMAGRGFAMLLGVPIPSQLVLEILTFGGFSAMMAVIFDLRILGGTFLFFLGGFATYSFPAYALELFVTFDALALLAVAFAWHQVSPTNNSAPLAVDTTDPNH